MTRFLWDENASHHLLRAVRRTRSDLDIVTVQQLGLTAASDPVVLDRAVADGRVLVTHDRSTILGIVAARKRAGTAVPGIVVVQLSKASIGDLASGLLFLAETAEPGDWENPLFVP